MNPLKEFGRQNRQRPHVERDAPEVRANQQVDSGGTGYFVLAEADASHPGAWLAAENPAEANR